MTCIHAEEQLLLYHYDELSPEEAAAVQARLATCASCQAVLDELARLEETLPAEPAYTPDEATLYAFRRDLAQRLYRPAAGPRWWASFRNAFTWQPAPMLAYMALAVVLVGGGFLLGQRGGTPLLPPDEGPGLQAFLRADGPLHADQSTLVPALAEVNTIAFDPASGQVTVRYRLLTDVELAGTPDDPAVQALMARALQAPQNPLARLDAVRVLQATQAPAQAAAPDSQIVAALLVMLQDEPNEGLRLQAMQALQHMYRAAPLAEPVKHVLLDVMLNDANEALRISALKTLTERPATGPDLQAYLQAAQADSNAFIRYRAGTLLGTSPDASNPRPLEQLPISQ